MTKLKKTAYILLLLIPVLQVISCNSKAEKNTTAPLIQKVSVQTVKKIDQSQVLTYSGTIEPCNTAQVGFAVPGVINNVAVQEGQFVNKGQLLATIDATEYINALAIANASLEQAEDMYRRLNELYQKGSLPEKDYIDIKTKLAQTRANKTINAKRITDSRLYAPMAGIITAKQVERGSTAAPGVPAFTIIKTDLVYAKISVAENEIGSLKKGMQATIEVPTIHKTLSGKITIINPQADPTSKTYVVKAQLPNNGQELLPGMIANVKINTGNTQQRIVIPAKAVLRDADDITYVYVVDSHYKAIRKRITTTGITGNQEIIIQEGLNDGDSVIVKGQTKVKDGTTVQL
jgi:RND family efflux transporter MFP subunit